MLPSAVVPFHGEHPKPDEQPPLPTATAPPTCATDSHSICRRSMPWLAYRIAPKGHVNCVSVQSVCSTPATVQKRTTRYEGLGPQANGTAQTNAKDNPLYLVKLLQQTHSPPDYSCLARPLLRNKHKNRGCTSGRRFSKCACRSVGHSGSSCFLQHSVAFASHKNSTICPVEVVSRRLSGTQSS